MISRAIGRGHVKDVGRAAGIVWKMRERVNSDAGDGYLREIWLRLVQISSSLDVLNLSCW